MPKQGLALYRTHRRWTETEARRALAALDASGLSTHAFAARQGIDAQRLQWWRRRFAKNRGRNAVGPRFIEVTPISGEQVELVLRGGRQLRFSTAIDVAALQRLVDALEQDAGC